jgi:hypothetical protein
MLRLAGGAEVRLTGSGANRHFQVAAGTVELAILRQGDRAVEVDTPSVTVRAKAAGAYRIGVNLNAETSVSVRRGRAEIVTPNQTYALDPGKTLIAGGSASNPQISFAAATAYDAFDAFNAQRDDTDDNALAQLPDYSSSSGGTDWYSAPVYYATPIVVAPFCSFAPLGVGYYGFGWGVSVGYAFTGGCPYYSVASAWYPGYWGGYPYYGGYWPFGFVGYSPWYGYPYPYYPYPYPYYPYKPIPPPPPPPHHHGQPIHMHPLPVTPPRVAAVPVRLTAEPVRLAPQPVHIAAQPVRVAPRPRIVEAPRRAPAVAHTDNRPVWDRVEDTHTTAHAAAPVSRSWDRFDRTRGDVEPGPVMESPRDGDSIGALRASPIDVHADPISVTRGVDASSHGGIGAAAPVEVGGHVASGLGHAGPVSAPVMSAPHISIGSGASVSRGSGGGGRPPN